MKCRQERWPGLHVDNRTEEPRQHLVGYLSADDADDYLRNAMVKDGTPVMDAAVGFSSTAVR